MERLFHSTLIHVRDLIQSMLVTYAAMIMHHRHTLYNSSKGTQFQHILSLNLDYFDINEHIFTHKVLRIFQRCQADQKVSRIAQQGLYDVHLPIFFSGVDIRPFGDEYRRFETSNYPG